MWSKLNCSHFMHSLYFGLEFVSPVFAFFFFIIFTLYIYNCYIVSNKLERGAGMGQCWERLPPTNVSRVRFQDPESCGLSLLLVLFSAPRGFSPGTPVFPSPQKPTFPNSNSIWNCQALYHEPLAWVIAQALPVFDIKFDFDLQK